MDPHAESILEAVARYHLLRAGFQISSQVHIPGVGRLDLVVDGVLGIEADDGSTTATGGSSRRTAAGGTSSPPGESLSSA
ncbi:hypothetical protein ACX80L_01935 [Arthrobacter sp. MDT1-48-3]